MSHNAKCYVKRIRKKDAAGMPTIAKLFKFASKKNDDSDKSAEIKDCGDESQMEHESEEGEKNDVSSEGEESEVESECGKISSPVSEKIDQRLFSSEKYENRYKWLYYSYPNRGYMCKVCEMFSTKSGIFTKGCSLGDHPTRVLETHAVSAAHKDAEQIQSSRKSGSVYSIILEKNIKKKIERKTLNRNVIKKLFQCANFMIHKQWALSENFSDFVKFVSHLGVDDILCHIETAPQTATYLSSTTVTELITILSERIERHLLLSLRNAEAFTLLADESCDEAGREQFALYGKWEDGEGEIKERYLGIINVPKTDSESLVNQIKHFMTAKDIQVKRMRFMAFDGANVMSGERTGVQRRLRHESPHALYMNCRCHKLALCLKHIMKMPEFAVLQEVDSVLLGLWKVFEYSPNKFSVFKEVQTTYGNKSLKLIRAATTRWLSHGAACCRFVSRFSQILDALDGIYDDRKEPEVFGLRCAMLRKDVVAMIYLLCDVLHIVNGLSTFLQTENLNFTDVPHKVDSAVNKLHILIDQLGDRGNNDHLTFSKIDDAFLEVIDRTSLQRRLRGNQLHNDMDYSPERFLMETGIPFIHRLLGEIEDAFHVSPVLRAFGTLDPRNLPDQITELANYGEDDITKLAEFYGSPKEDQFQGHMVRVPSDLQSPQAAVAEFRAFKTHMFVESYSFPFLPRQSV